MRCYAIVSLGAMESLEGRRAIVTGASSGIGAATTQALREAGARVYTGSRREGNLDVTDAESVQAFVDAALKELGGLDILFNNAGLSRGRDPVWDSLEDDEREVIETNVLGLMRMTRLCVPELIASGHGHIVNMGSVAGIWSYPSGSSYVASKFAVHGYTRALRDDLQGKPVRVTNIAAGLVETDFSKVRFKGDEEKAKAVYSNVVLGGPLNAQDVAECVMFALTRRPNVNIDEVVVMALAQVSGANVLRS
jgi:3-hydroxy acid dehydrogenase/malonic semialdehyde reductase